MQQAEQVVKHTVVCNKWRHLSASFTVLLNEALGWQGHFKVLIVLVTWQEVRKNTSVSRTLCHICWHSGCSVCVIGECTISSGCTTAEGPSEIKCSGTQVAVQVGMGTLQSPSCCHFNMERWQVGYNCCLILWNKRKGKGKTFTCTGSTSATVGCLLLENWSPGLWGRG